MSARSPLLDELAAQLARFDEEAWIALANRGLLRRALKDLETQLPELADDGGPDAAAVTVNVGGQRVRFDARGPAQARCSCPAAGVCQHILAAAIGLQRMTAAQAPPGQAGGRAGAPAMAPAPPPALPVPAQQPEAAQAAPAAAVAAAPAERAVAADGLAAELLSLPAKGLIAHAGVAGYRWAWQYVQDLDPQRGLALSGGRSIVLAFRHPRITLRYMGGGLAAMIADAATPHLARMQVAAALAFRRLNGIEDAPAPASPASTARKPKPQAAQDDSRARLLAAVCSAAVHSLGLGLSHLSATTRQRFATLAVWAQGAECYRLALMLRRIADHVEALLERGAGADEHRLLEELALACALARALQGAGAQPPMHLLGRARSNYEGGGKLDLLGLGAHAWRSPAGYTGLTMLFWSESEQEFAACTEARPELQRGFDPVARYRAPGPWQGLHAPAAATGRLVRLIHPQLNDKGRLSPSDRTTASVEPAADLAARLPARRCWADLAEERSRPGRGLLSEPDPMRDWCVLAPSRWGALVFDAARQTLCWPVYDEHGAALHLELAYSPLNAAAIDRIEARAPHIAAGTLLVARLADTAAGMIGEPLSLVLPGGGETPVECLHFPAAAKDSEPSAGRQAGSPARQAGTAGGGEEGTRHAPALQPVREFRRWLNQQAERGVQAHRLPAFAREYAVRSAQLAAQGYTLFQHAGEATPERLLWACYLCMQLDKLAGRHAAD